MAQRPRTVAIKPHLGRNERERSRLALRAGHRYTSGLQNVDPNHLIGLLGEKVQCNRVGGGFSIGSAYIRDLDHHFESVHAFGNANSHFCTLHGNPDGETERAMRYEIGYLGKSLAHAQPSLRNATQAVLRPSKKLSLSYVSAHSVRK